LKTPLPRRRPGGPGRDIDTQAIIDGVVTTLSQLQDGFTGWIAGARTAYIIASTRWKQFQAAEELPGMLGGILSFAKGDDAESDRKPLCRGRRQAGLCRLVETTL
jgi:hypothetical protein